MVGATRILGQKIGKPDLQYQQFPDAAVGAGLQQAGFSAAVADSFVGMSHAFNANRVALLQPRTPANTGKTAFESFADVFAHVYAQN